MEHLKYDSDKGSIIRKVNIIIDTINSKPEVRSKKDCLLDYGIDTSKLDIDFVSNLFWAMEKYSNQFKQ